MADEVQQPGTMVITLDGVCLGTFESDEGTHLKVRLADADTPVHSIFVPKRMVSSMGDGEIRLRVERADIHDAVYALPPGEQREYSTLGNVRPLGRAFDLAR